MLSLSRVATTALAVGVLCACGLLRDEATPTDAAASAAPFPVAEPATAPVAEPVAVEPRPPLLPAARFATLEVDGRLWVFREEAEELVAARRGEFSEAHVTAIGAGPGGVTVKAPDSDTLLSYLACRPGYEAYLHEDRIWVFPIGSEEALEFRRGHRSEKHVTAIGAGPDGMTVKAADTETLNGYLAAAPGFVTGILDGRVWVFPEGSEEAAAFLAGEVAEKHVTAIGAGPMGMTVKASDAETLNRYLAVIGGR